MTHFGTLEHVFCEEKFEHKLEIEIEICFNIRAK